MKWHYAKANDFPVGNSTRERMCIGETKWGEGELEFLTYSDYDHHWYDPVSKDPWYDKYDVVRWICLKDIKSQDNHIKECAYVVQTSSLDDGLWVDTVDSYMGSYEEALQHKHFLEKEHKDKKVRIIVREIYEWLVE